MQSFALLVGFARALGAGAWRRRRAGLQEGTAVPMERVVASSANAVCRTSLQNS
jgi:hypothetical protein